MAVDDNTELDQKSRELEVLLEGGVVGAEWKHIGGTVADQKFLCQDHSIANKEKNSHYIDFEWNTTQFPLIFHS